jgi:hypothetical protein
MKALNEVVESLKTGSQIHTTGNMLVPSGGATNGSLSRPKASSITSAPLTDQQLQSAIGRLLTATGYAGLTATTDPAFPWQAAALTRLASICEQQNAPRNSIDEARRVMRELLRPAPEEPMAVRIMALMTHYYDPKMGESVRSVVLLDWCRMLGQYPLWAIESAVDQWLSKEHRKPTPKMILDLLPYAVRSVSIKREAA